MRYCFFGQWLDVAHCVYPIPSQFVSVLSVTLYLKPSPLTLSLRASQAVMSSAGVKFLVLTCPVKSGIYALTPTYFQAGKHVTEGERHFDGRRSLKDHVAD